MIRVLHVIRRMDVGGAETFIMNMYRHIDRSVIQFDFVENTESESKFDKEIINLGGKIFRCPHYNGLNHLQYIKWWRGFFEEHRNEYYIIHGHLGSTAAIYLSIAKDYGLKTIAHSHNTYSKGIREILYYIYSYKTRFIADYLFACSKEAGISRYGRRFAAGDNSYVVRNAIDTKQFSYNETNKNIIRKRLGIEDKVVFGHVGRFMKQKNHEYLIDIFCCIKSKIDNAMLLLIGDGYLRKEIEDKVNRLKLNDCVLFLGVQRDVSAYYSAMDCFLFPSINEGLGIVLIEAQNSGLHCIVSDCIPDESIICDELVCKMSLESPPEFWAEKAIGTLKEDRKDYTLEIQKAHYDIVENANWLGKFYISCVKQANETPNLRKINIE